MLDSDLREIRIFSRDEKKQEDMRIKYNNSKIKFYIGDVRDVDSVQVAMTNVDYVFHAAALKQVPSCEFFPMEAYKTNVIGTENVLNVAIQLKVRKVVCLSTDKAVSPINAMGISKAMMEKIALAKSRLTNQTIISITRYGNVMASRGSVIPLFAKQILSKQPVTVTDPEMTRFMMTLEEAVKLVIYAFNNGKSGDIFIQKSPSVSMQVLSQAMIELIGDSKNKTQIIGTRHGEKKFESLLSREEMSRSEDLGNYYRVIPDQRNLNYRQFVELGELKISEFSDYNSSNTKQLSLAETKQLLKRLILIKSILSGEVIHLDP